MPESDQVRPRRVRPLPPPPPPLDAADGSWAPTGAPSGGAGTDGAGTDSAGTDGAGTDSAGTDSAGTDGAGTDSARPVRWGLGDAAAGWLIGLVGGAVAYQLVLSLSGTDPEATDSLGIGWIAVAQLGLWFGLLGTPWVVSRMKGNGMRRDFGLAATWRDGPVGGLWGLAGQYAIVSLVYIPMSWFVDISRDEFSEPAREMTDRATDPLGIALLVLIVGIGAPIVEEIFYRGLVQRSLINRFGSVWGIAMASIVFGAVHLQVLQFPALALAGLLFGVLAYRYGRLGPAIAAHMVFNLTAVTALVLTS